MAIEIGQHCQTVVNIINERDFKLTNPSAKTLIRNHIATEFHARLDHFAYTLTFSEEVEFWRQMAIEYPDTRFELLGVDTFIRSDDRTADVVMRTIMTRDNMKLLFACELKWKFTGNSWVWYSQRGMRGLATPV